MKKNKFIPFVAALALALSLSACIPNTPAPTPAPTPSQSPSPTPSATSAVQHTGFAKSAAEAFGDACTISGTTVKLNKNVTLKENASLVMKSAEVYTIDFNGYTVAAKVTQAGGAVISCTNGGLFIKDSVGGGGIALTSNVEAYALSSAFEGALTVSDIKVAAALTGASYEGITKNRTGAYALQVREGGKLTVNGGSFGGNIGLVTEYARRKPTVLLNGGTFSGFADLNGAMNISDLLGAGKKAVTGPDGSITISNG